MSHNIHFPPYRAVLCVLRSPSKTLAIEQRKASRTPEACETECIEIQPTWSNKVNKVGPSISLRKKCWSACDANLWTLRDFVCFVSAAATLIRGFKSSAWTAALPARKEQNQTWKTLKKPWNPINRNQPSKKWWTNGQVMASAVKTAPSCLTLPLAYDGLCIMFIHDPLCVCVRGLCHFRL